MSPKVLRASVPSKNDLGQGEKKSRVFRREFVGKGVFLTNTNQNAPVRVSLCMPRTRKKKQDASPSSRLMQNNKHKQGERCHVKKKERPKESRGKKKQRRDERRQRGRPAASDRDGRASLRARYFTP